MKTTSAFLTLLLTASGVVVAQQPEEQPGASQSPAQAQQSPAQEEQQPAQAQQQPAQAQQPPAQNEPETRIASADRQQEGGFISSAAPDQIRTDELEGSDVLDGEGTNVGKVHGLLIDENGEAAGLLVRVGGIVGVGGRTVAVPWSSAQIQERKDGRRGYTVQTQMSRQQFETAPEFPAADEH